MNPAINREWSRQRRAVRAALRRGDHDRTIALADAFDRYCEAHGWPDYWSDIDRARGDAQSAIARSRRDPVWG